MSDIELTEVERAQAKVSVRIMAEHIKEVSKLDIFWQIMVNESDFRAGPFDGGCLTCANAIIEASPVKAELARIIDVDTKITHHYGVLINGSFLDFDGRHKTTFEWIANFRENENLANVTLAVAMGLDTGSEILNDPVTAAKVTRLLLDCD